MQILKRRQNAFSDIGVKNVGIHQDFDVKDAVMEEKVIAEYEEETNYVGDIGVNTVDMAT